jgi:predicted dehydrogenase
MRIGVVGAGWWGKNIINTFEEIEQVERVDIYDENPQTLQKFGQNKKTDCAGSLKELIGNNAVNAICIATPSGTHYDLAKAALAAGKHVLVEKPPALTVTQIDELGEMARSRSLVYMLDALYLFLEPIKKIKELLDSGEAGDMRFIQMYRIGDELRREGAGLQRIQKTMFDNRTDVIDDLFFHDAGILLYLLNKVSMESVEKYFFYNQSLCDSARIKLRSGEVPIELTLSWSFVGRKRGIAIYTGEQIIEYDGLKSEDQITLLRLSDQQRQVYSFPSVPPLKAQLEFFVDCITGKCVNHINADFMKTIIRIWSEIKNER